jgi:hypothetical protein
MSEHELGELLLGAYGILHKLQEALSENEAMVLALREVLVAESPERKAAFLAHFHKEMTGAHGQESASKVEYIDQLARKLTN